MPAHHSRPIPILVVLALLLGTCRADGPPAKEPDAGALRPISVRGFSSGINHWRNIRNDRLIIQAIAGQPSHPPGRVRDIAANIVLFQRDNGGWPSNHDMTAVLTSEQAAKVAASRSKADASFDNDNVHSQVDYLARAVAQRADPAWRSACERGFDFLLEAQYPGGGFPQTFPGPKGFHAHITFNDGVMIGILAVLADAAQDADHFRWLDAARRDRARDAVRRGVECIRKCQIRVGGEATGWCQQHDEATFEPRPGRTFELASACPQETTAIVRFLMRLGPPSPEVRAMTDPAVAWLGRVKLAGVRVAKVKAPAESFLRHDADFDVVVSPDAEAGPVWARHYEIGTDRPVFAGRDGVRRYALAEIERERRTGTPWYGTWPAALLKDYPDWLAPGRSRE